MNPFFTISPVEGRICYQLRAASYGGAGGGKEFFAGGVFRGMGGVWESRYSRVAIFVKKRRGRMKVDYLSAACLTLLMLLGVNKPKKSSVAP